MGDVKDSYQAFYETMDDFEGRAAKDHERKMKDLEAKMPSDFDINHGLIRN